jgi:hypothetical protein
MESLVSQNAKLRKELDILKHRHTLAIDANMYLQDEVMRGITKLNTAKRVISKLKDRIEILKSPLRAIYKARAELKNMILTHKYIKQILRG